LTPPAEHHPVAQKTVPPAKVTAPTKTTPPQEEDHTVRNVAIGAAALTTAGLLLWRRQDVGEFLEKTFGFLKREVDGPTPPLASVDEAVKQVTTPRPAAAARHSGGGGGGSGGGNSFSNLEAPAAPAGAGDVNLGLQRANAEPIPLKGNVNLQLVNSDKPFESMTIQKEFVPSIKSDATETLHVSGEELPDPLSQHIDLDSPKPVAPARNAGAGTVAPVAPVQAPPTASATPAPALATTAGAGDVNLGFQRANAEPIPLNGDVILQNQEPFRPNSIPTLQVSGQELPDTLSRNINLDSPATTAKPSAPTASASAAPKPPATPAPTPTTSAGTQASAGTPTASGAGAGNAGAEAPTGPPASTTPASLPASPVAPRVKTPVPARPETVGLLPKPIAGLLSPGKSAQALPQDASRASARVAKVLQAGEPYRAIKVAVSALQRNPKLDKEPLLKQINDILITLSSGEGKLDKLIPNDLRGANKIGFYETLVQAIATKNNHTNLRFILLEDLADLYKSTNPDRAIALLQERLALVNSPNTQVRNVLEKLAGLHVAKKEYSKAIKVSEQMEAEVVRVIQSIEQATNSSLDPLIHNHRLSSDLTSIRTSIVTLAKSQYDQASQTGNKKECVKAYKAVRSLLKRDSANEDALFALAEFGKKHNNSRIEQRYAQKYLDAQPDYSDKVVQARQAIKEATTSATPAPAPAPTSATPAPASATPARQAPTVGAGTAPVAQAGAGAGAQAPAGRGGDLVQRVTPQVIPSAEPIPFNLKDAGRTNVESLTDLSQGEAGRIGSRGSTATEHKKRKGLRLLLHDLRVQVVALLTGDDDKLLNSLGEFDE
jgi:tetratricopeptide (TPR) repeat protein